MMKELFYKRLHTEWREKYKAISSIIDWTIALYFIIPLCIFSGLYYKSLWEELPEWTNSFPTFFLFMVLYILVIRGEVRSFLEEGEQLFLIQYRSYMNELIVRGAVYTFIRIVISSMFIIMVLLPFLLNWLQFNVMEVAWLYGFFVLFRFSFSFLNRFLLYYRPSWWKKQLLLMGIRSISITMFISGCIWGVKYILVGVVYLILLSGIIFVCVQKKLHIRSYFYMEVQRERDRKMRWTRMVLLQGMHLSKPVTRSQSRLFPNSKRIFNKETSGNRIIESYIKSYFRKSDNRMVYINLVLVACIGIVVTPIWIKIMVGLFLLFALVQLAKGEWRVFQESIFIKLYCGDVERLVIENKARWYVIYPALMIVGSICIGMFSILLGVFALILTTIILCDYVL